MTAAILRRGGPWWAGLGLLAVYVALAGGHTYSIDGLLMFEQARALALHGSIHFAEPVVWSGVYTDSKYGIGQSLLYVPFLWLLTHLGLHAAYVPSRHVDDFYVWIGPWLIAAVTACTAVLMFQLARLAGASWRAAWWAFVLFGLGSPALVYARGDWAQPLSGLCWVAALYCALRLRRSWSVGFAAGLAAAVVFGLLTRVVDGAFAATTAGVLLLPRWRALAVLLAAGAVGVGLTLLVGWARFGSAFATGYSEGWSTPVLIGLWGSLFSPARGLLWEFPAIGLAPAGFWWLWRRGDRALAVALAGGCLVELVSTAAWRYWWGGYDWELRLFVPALPLLAVLAGVGIDRLLGPVLAQALLAALLGIGLLSSLPPLFVDMNAGYGHFADGTAASWQVAAYPLFGALKFRHTGLDFFWWREAHRHRSLLVLPMVVRLVGLWMIWRKETGALVARRP